MLLIWAASVGFVYRPFQGDLTQKNHSASCWMATRCRRLPIDLKERRLSCSRNLHDGYCVESNIQHLLHHLLGFSPLAIRIFSRFSWFPLKKLCRVPLWWFCQQKKKDRKVNFGTRGTPPINPSSHDPLRVVLVLRNFWLWLILIPFGFIRWSTLT